MTYATKNDKSKKTKKHNGKTQRAKKKEVGVFRERNNNNRQHTNV